MSDAALRIGPAQVQHGPAALAGGLRRFAVLTWTMAVLQFKLRFFGSALGYLWQLMRPLLLFGVLYLVFTQAFKLSANVRSYPAVLLTGIVLWTFFADATSTAVGSVVDNENIVRKVHFPRLAIPASVVLTSLFNLALNFLAVAVFLVASGVRPHWGWFELPFLFVYLVMLVLGLAMLLSSLFVRYRDVQPIWDVVLQIGFYGSPILYVLEKVSVPSIRTVLLHANPMAPFLQEVRHALVDPTAPSAASVMGGTWHLLVPVAMVLGIFCLGLWKFAREAPVIAEDL